MIGIGLAIRAILGPLFGGYGYDIRIFRNWASTLITYPRSEFYATARAPDHLPGDLWIMEAAVRSFFLLGGETTGDTGFRLVLKLVPFVADALVAVLLARAVRSLGNPNGSVGVAALYFLNPAVIFLSAAWGQWDSVSAMLLLIGIVLCLVAPGWQWMAATPFLTWAVLIKPQLAIAAGLTCLIPVRRSTGRAAGLVSLLGQGIVAILLTVIWLLALIVPFDVGVDALGTRWSLGERISVALDLYPALTLGASNLWMIDQGSIARYSDQQVGPLGATLQTWGTIMLGAGLAWTGLVLLRWWQGAFVNAWLWAALASSWCVFMLPTRVHERYLFPALVFGALFVASRGFRAAEVRIFWVASVLFMVNLAMIYGGLSSIVSKPTASEIQGEVLRAVAIGNTVVFALVLWFPFSRRFAQPGA